MFILLIFPQLVFNGLLGSQNIVLELRSTNKVFHIRNAVCEEKNQCINFEVKSVFKRTEPKHYKHELLVAVDLRKFGYAYEFGLQSDTVRDGFTFSHTFDAHLQAQDKTRYQYGVLIDGKKASITLTLPSRTIALDTKYHIGKEVFGKHELMIASYLDRANKPQSRALVGFVVDVQRPTKNAITSRTELKFSHPAMRELHIVSATDFNADRQTASGRLELDLFRDADQQIIVTGRYGNANADAGSGAGFNVSSELSVLSKGLGFEYAFNGHAAGSLERRQVSVGGQFVSPTPDLRVGFYAFGSDHNAELLVTGFNEELVHVTGTFDSNKMNAELRSTCRLLGTRPIVGQLTVSGMTAFTGAIEREKLLKINGEFSVGKEASLVLVGADKELFRGKVALDQANFLTSEYKVNDNDIKAFIVSIYYTGLLPTFPVSFGQ